MNFPMLSMNLQVHARAIPVDAYGSNTIINSTLFHSQKCSNLDNQLLHGHHVYGLKEVFTSFARLIFTEVQGSWY